MLGFRPRVDLLYTAAAVAFVKRRMKGTRRTAWWWWVAPWTLEGVLSHELEKSLETVHRSRIRGARPIDRSRRL